MSRPGPNATGLALATLAALAACDGGKAPVIDIAIIHPDGTAPLDGFETIAITVRQGEGEVLTSEGTVSADGFDVRVAITDYANPIDLSVTLDGPSGPVLGGAPTFIPGETGRAGDPNGLVVVAVGAPSTCAVVANLSLEDRRSFMGLSQQGTFLAALGGIDAAGPSTTASFLDLLRLGVEDDPETTGRLAPFSEPLGRTRSYAYSNSRAVVFSELVDPFVFDITGACDADDPPPEGCFVRLLPAGLHRDATSLSSAIELREGGVLVVGGGTVDDRSVEASFIEPDGEARRIGLSTGRASPLLVELEGGAILVVGGEVDGAYAEIVREDTGAGLPIADARVGGIVRTGGALYADPSGQSALLVGGEAPDGSLIEETELFLGCPSACRIVAGPRWDGARREPTHVRRRQGGGLIVGGGDSPVPTIDGVGWADAASPSFYPHGDLVAGRQGASALVLDNGVVLVGGGIDDSGPRLDVEMCFPESMALP